MTAAILTAIALAAGIDTSKVTEANAAETLKGIHTRITTLESDKTSLTQRLSAESASEVDPTVRALSAELLDGQVDLVFGGIVSDKGMKEIKNLISSDAAGKPAGMILTAEAPMEVVSLFKSIAKIIKANPGLRKGPLTQLQTIALTDEHAATTNTPPTAERLAEILGSTQTGRSILADAKK